MNMAEEIAGFMETDLMMGTFGVDIFVGGAPKGAKDCIWWLIASGGSTEQDNATGEKIKIYTVEVYHRDIDEQSFYDNLELFETTINSLGCIDSLSYNIIDISAMTYPVDMDLDNEDRKIGLVELKIRTYL